MSLSDIYNKLSKAEEPPQEDKEKIVWLDNDDQIENPQKQMLLDKLTQYHANAARPFEMLSSHMYGNHVYDLGNPEETKEINYEHYAEALRAYIKHKTTIEEKMHDQEVQEALDKPIGQFAMTQWYPANGPAHVMGIKVASHVLGKDHPDILKVGHAATDAGTGYLSDLEEQGETFSPEKHLAPLHQAMLNACAEGTPDMYTGEPLVYSEPPKPGSLGALKQKAPDISKSYKSNKKNFSEYDDVPLHEIYNQLSKSYKTAAWQRAEGQNPKGGLNAKGRASARAEGHNLKPPVKSGDNPRRASFLARMGNSPGPEYDEHGKPTRLLLSLQAWGASSKADAKRKAKAISARLKMRKSGNDIIHSFDENDPLNWRQPDFTDQYNTELNPEQEAAYQNWLSIQKKVPTSTHDYDLKGFFADQVFGKTDTSEHEGHFDDRWKKPNHMTFSDQSNYAQILPDGSSTGGRWIEHLSPKDDPNPNRLGHYTFAMSPHQGIPEQAMREYFQREESHNSFFDPKTHVIHEGEIPLTDQHVDQLIQEGVAYPSLYGLQKVNNVRNLAPSWQTIRGVRYGGETNRMSSAKEEPVGGRTPIMNSPQPGFTPRPPSFKLPGFDPVKPPEKPEGFTPRPASTGPGGFTPPPVLASPGGFTPRPASTGPGGFTPPSPLPSVDPTNPMKKSWFSVSIRRFE